MENQAVVVEQMHNIGLYETMGFLGLTFVVGVIFVVGFFKGIKK